MSLHCGCMFKGNCVMQKNKTAKWDMGEGKRTAQTHLSIIPLVSPPLRSHQRSIQPPITKRRNGLAFYSSEIHRLYIRTQFGLVMRLRLCISPCRQPNLQLPAHMGALAGRLRGNRLGKSVAFFHLERMWWSKKGREKKEDCGGSPRVIFSTRPWEISEIWGQGCFFNKGSEYTLTSPAPTCVDRCEQRWKIWRIGGQDVYLRLLQWEATFSRICLCFLSFFPHCGASSYAGYHLKTPAICLM